MMCGCDDVPSNRFRIVFGCRSSPYLCLSTKGSVFPCEETQVSVLTGQSPCCTINADLCITLDAPVLHDGHFTALFAKKSFKAMQWLLALGQNVD
jgi:hypothetical protein